MNFNHLLRKATRGKKDDDHKTDKSEPNTYDGRSDNERKLRQFIDKIKSDGYSIHRIIKIKDHFDFYVYKRDGSAGCTQGVVSIDLPGLENQDSWEFRGGNGGRYIKIDSTIGESLMKADNEKALTALEADKEFQIIKKMMQNSVRDSSATKILNELGWYYNDTFQKWSAPANADIFDKEKIEKDGITINIHDQIEWLIDHLIAGSNNHRTLKAFLDNNKTFQSQLDKMGTGFVRDQVTGVTTQIIAALEQILDDREDDSLEYNKQTVRAVFSVLPPTTAVEIRTEDHREDEKFEYLGPVKYLNLDLYDRSVTEICNTNRCLVIYIKEHPTLN